MVPWLILLLEMKICWSSRSDQYGRPILDEIAVSKRSVSIFLEELVGIEVLSRCLASRGEEQMVTPEASRIWCYEESIDKHGKGNSPIIY